LMMLSDQPTNGSVEAFDAKKQELLGRLSTQIGKIKRLLTGNKIIAFESLEPLSNQLAGLERKMALLQQAEHPSKIERRQQKADQQNQRVTYLLGENPNDEASVRVMGQRHVEAVKKAQAKVAALKRKYLESQGRTGDSTRLFVYGDQNKIVNTYNEDLNLAESELKGALNALSEYNQLKIKYTGDRDITVVPQAPLIR